MRIAVAADEDTHVAQVVVEWLRAAGHDLTVVGPLAGGDQEWVAASADAARLVSSGHCERAVVLCWSGTGASIAANKVSGVRAALCTDAPTARMAREYNHANVLALSMRLTAGPVAEEILEAFLAEPDGEGDFNRRNLAALGELELGGEGDLAWPAPTRGRPELWWDDIEVGMRVVTPAVSVGADAIAAFARCYDPQPFHLDPEAGRSSVFGAQVASGWHTAAIAMRLFVDHGPRVAGGLVGLGVREISWGPLLPESQIHLECEVVRSRRSKGRPDRGVVEVRLVVADQRGGVVQSLTASLIVPVRVA